MIIFTGITTKDNITFLNLKSDTGEVSIPIDPLTADRISKYLSKISPPAPKMELEVEAGS